MFCPTITVIFTLDKLRFDTDEGLGMGTASSAGHSFPSLFLGSHLPRWSLPTLHHTQHRTPYSRSFETNLVMFLKLPALLAVASAAISCLAAPHFDGSGLAARSNFAGKQHVQPSHRDQGLSIFCSC